MWRDLDATVFVERPTTIEYIDGHFIITDNFGGTTLRRCFSPQTFLASFAYASEAIAKWKLDTMGGNVVPLAIGRK